MSDPGHAGSLAIEFYQARAALERVSRKGKRPVRERLSPTSYAEMGGSIGQPIILLRIKEQGILAKIPLPIFQALIRWGHQVGLDTLDIEREVLSGEDRLL